jgi:hypothetical protein
VKRVGWIVIVAIGCYAGPDGGGDTDNEESGGTSPSSSSASGGPTTAASGAATSAGTSDTSDSDPSGGEETGPPATGPLLERLFVTDVTVPQGVQAGVSNWRIWGTGSLHVAPMFTVPLANCETLVGYTSEGGTAHAVHLDASDALIGVMDLGSAVELRGLAAESDGHFGALIWDPAGQDIYVRRFDLAGMELWSTQLVNADNHPTDFGIGDSRLEWGGGSYGAYYHVHSDSGHEGDTLKWVAADSGAETTGWSWGCSHSMSAVLRFSPTVDAFMPACVTDCYPGTSGDFATQSIGGIYLNHSQSHVLDVDAGCNGSVAGELGGAALTPGGWALVFNAHQAAATLGQSSYDLGSMNQDIGLSMIGGDLSPGPVVWLTSTGSVNEDDASIERWEPEGEAAEQYLVGWHEPGAERWQLARIDAAGAFLEGPVDVSAAAQWGRRDDPFRRHFDGDVVWSWFDAPGSTTLHVARVRSGGTCPG